MDIKLSTICFFVSNIKMRENCRHTCCFSKDFANCLILSTAYWLMLELNLNLMQFIECGLIWRRIPSVEEFVVIWDWNCKIHQMNSDIEMMVIINKIWPVWQNVWISSSQFKELNNLSTILHICWISLLKHFSIIFTCFLALFLDTGGKRWKVWHINSNNKNITKDLNLKDTHMNILQVKKRNKSKL